MSTATRWVAAAVGAALLFAPWVGSELDDPDPARPAALAHAAPAAPTPAARAGAPLSADPQLPKPREPAAFERWMAQQSSLRGVVLDGAWDVAADGRLHPTLALRRRFDQLLSLLGEASLEEITGYIAYDVAALAGPVAAQRVLEVWQRYLRLQRHPFQAQPDMRDRHSWMPALAERQQVRRQILGDEIAAAFFAEEEAQLQALLQGTPPAASPMPTTRIDRASLSPQALARVKEEDAAWADWQRRLADARREWAALQTDAGLSAAQRIEAIERYLGPRFSGSERLRVRAQVKLPPGA